jgi:lysophospholipase L1-like esterase
VRRIAQRGRPRIAMRPTDSAPRFQRYVAIGDSSTEGLMDPDGRGGYRGWSRRLAQRIADAQGGLLYANLGVRGLTTRQILETQLEPALALRPDLATVFSGTNDVIARDFDPDVFARDAEATQRALTGAGARVLTFTLPDLTPLMPLARRIAPRIHALNERLREAARGTGTTLVDFAAHPVATDRRLWNPDRIHANSSGHARIAGALAHALGLPGADPGWSEPLPQPLRDGPAARMVREAYWRTRYLLPWMIARSAGVAARPRAVRAELVTIAPADRGADPA